ncbi:WD repeat-containing protein WRAP73-like [Gigantopelta aegis]|uniref:WD repeat-containing protein WRAP73-like n=1 Tax=Gigantopelta aegis TaxID=1735272 RepID=UPI001B88D6AF|nr:WD repeat-containing protein WRAP73-like [Gigantopelta aegis]
MNFSELFRQSRQLSKFSPDGKYLASTVDYRLMVRDVDTLQIQCLFSCLDHIQHFEWSPDSEFILCAMYKRGMVQVWSIEQPDWHCKIDEGSFGMLGAQWSPDSRNILTTAEFHLRITIWSLATLSVSHIRYPKQIDKNVDFTLDGKYMALAERRNCKDFISLFACNTWELVKHYETETEDMAGLKFCPDGLSLILWDDCRFNKLLVYSLDGRCLRTFSPYEYRLGVKSVAWSPSGQFLAVGFFDEKVRILNHITWNKIASFSHPASLKSTEIVVFKETESRCPQPNTDLSNSSVTLFNSQSKYEVVSTPLKLPVVSPNGDSPMFGIGKVEFSADNKYMFTQNDNMPTVIWIWSIRKMALSEVLVHSSPVRCAMWDPVGSCLALCTANNKLYMWSPNGCLTVQVPTEGSFTVHSVKWHPSGKILLMQSKDQMCVCFLSTATNDKTTEVES